MFRSTKQVKNGTHALTFLRFFIQKGEMNQEIWRNLYSSIESSLKNSDVNTIVEIAELLKANDKLNSSLSQSIWNEIKNRLDSIDPNQLASAAMMLWTLESHDNEIISQIDKLLVGNVEAESDLKTAYENLSKLSIESFITICHLAHKHNHFLKNFMIAGKHYVEENIEKFTITELSHALKTFAYFGEDRKIMEKGEKLILKNSTKISIIEWIRFMEAYSVYGGGEDIWTLFDVIIGKNARLLQADQIIPILKWFASSRFKREKLFIVLQHFVKNFEFSLSENSKIIRIYGEMLFNQEHIYDLMDKRLSSNILEMNETDIINAIIGFTNPNTVFLKSFFFLVICK